MMGAQRDWAMVSAEGPKADQVKASLLKASPRREIQVQPSYRGLTAVKSPVALNARVQGEAQR